MPKFESPFSGNDLNRRLSRDETLRAVRLAIAAEYEAIQMYEQIATASDDPVVQLVMASVAREEMIHAGEFLALLKRLSPDEGLAYQEGNAETVKIMGKVGK